MNTSVARDTGATNKNPQLLHQRPLSSDHNIILAGSDIRAFTDMLMQQHFEAVRECDLI
jgi:hypothetical protein